MKSLIKAASAASVAAEGELMVYACRRGSLRFCMEPGQSQSLHAGELAVWKTGWFLSGTIEPDESFAGFCLRFDLKKLTEQPPESLLGADVTAERLYDLYCAQETMTRISPDDALRGILDFFYGQSAKTALPDSERRRCFSGSGSGGRKRRTRRTIPPSRCALSTRCTHSSRRTLTRA